MLGAIRLAVSLGGDCDTLTCITGSVAEASANQRQPANQSANARKNSTATEAIARACTTPITGKPGGRSLSTSA